MLAVPAFENLQLGQPVAEIPSKTPLMVVEKGTATSIAADGEIPYKLEPNEKSNYADLTGKNNAFGTIDYGMNPPFVFVGQEVTLADIGLAHAKSAERAERQSRFEGDELPELRRCVGTRRARQSRARNLSVLQFAFRCKSRKFEISCTRSNLRPRRRNLSHRSARKVRSNNLPTARN